MDNDYTDYTINMEYTVINPLIMWDPIAFILTPPYLLWGNDENENDEQGIIHRSLFDCPAIQNVVTDEVVKRDLVPILFKNARHRENHAFCSITREELTQDDEIIQLPCMHCFLVEPIMKWLTEESCECPVCRYALESKEKKRVNQVQVNQVNNDVNNNNPFSFSFVFIPEYYFVDYEIIYNDSVDSDSVNSDSVDH